MTVEFTLPELGENIVSGDVVSILVSVGDTLNIDDPVLELETDKATVEVPSTISGVVTAVEITVGDTIKVGQLILTTNSQVETPQLQEVPVVVEATPEASPQTEKTAPPVPEIPSGAVQPPAPMLVELILPDLGENITGGDVVGVLVAIGDTIAKDQGMVELETDKATIEVPSTVAGVVKQIHVQEGDTAKVGQVIITVETVEKVATPAPPPVSPQPLREISLPQPLAAPEQIEETSAVGASSTLALDINPNRQAGLVSAAPNVRRLARELGVNVAAVHGTGPAGRISMNDIKQHANATLQMLRAGRAVTGVTVQPAAAVPLPDFSKWGAVERQPMSNIRKATARQMTVSWSTIPHVTQFDKADITDLEQLRKRFGAKVETAGGKLTITAILLKVVAAALKEYPQFNASIDMAAEEIVVKSYIHIGVAVDTDRGLLVPVIRNVDQKNIMEMAVELGQIAEKARDRKLKLDDMQGGTFTITNLGGIGGTNFTPIVNAPEVAILGVARGGQEPVFKNGQFEPRLMLPLSLSYDHRLIDGADGARFLRFIVEYLEQPFLTALQGW